EVEAGQSVDDPARFAERYNEIANGLMTVTKDAQTFVQRINGNRGAAKQVLMGATAVLAGIPLLPFGAGAFICAGAGTTGAISAGSGGTTREVVADVATHMVTGLIGVGVFRVASPALVGLYGRTLAGAMAGAGSGGIAGAAGITTQVGIRQCRLPTADELQTSVIVG